MDITRSRRDRISAERRFEGPRPSRIMTLGSRSLSVVRGNLLKYHNGISLSFLDVTKNLHNHLQQRYSHLRLTNADSDLTNAVLLDTVTQLPPRFPVSIEVQTPTARSRRNRRVGFNPSSRPILALSSFQIQHPFSDRRSNIYTRVRHHGSASPIEATNLPTRDTRATTVLDSLASLLTSLLPTMALLLLRQPQ